MNDAKLSEKKGNYYAVFYDPDRYPKRKTVTLKTKRRKTATKRLEEMETAIRYGEFDPWEDKPRYTAITVGDAADAFLEANARRRRASTQSNDRRLLAQFARSLKPNMKLGHVTAKDVQAFLDAPKVVARSKKKPTTQTREKPAARSEDTKRTYYARLNAFFGWAERERYVARNPLSKVEKPARGEGKPFYLTRDQYRAVLSAIEKDAEAKRGGQIHRTSLKPGEVDWLADIVRVAVGTGLRSGEIRNLRWDAVNLDDKLVTVRNVRKFKTKSGHERAVPIDGEALSTLRRLDEARPDRADAYVFKPTSTVEGTNDIIDGGYMNKRFKAYAKAAGLSSRVTFHTLRHTYASWLVMSGTSLLTVKYLMGHANIKTTEQYAHLDPRLYREAVARTFG